MITNGSKGERLYPHKAYSSAGDAQQNQQTGKVRRQC